MGNVEEVKKKSKGKQSRYGKRYGYEFKLRCVKLRLEEGIPVSLISKEAGCSQDVIRRWARAYQEQGEAGLRNAMVPGGGVISGWEAMGSFEGELLYCGQGAFGLVSRQIP